MDPGNLVTEPLVVEPANGADIRAEAAEAEAMPRMSATASCVPSRLSSTARTQTTGTGRTPPKRG